MTEPLPPSDELASRYLDGDLPEDLAALVERDASLSQRVEQLSLVRARLADVPTELDATAEALLGQVLQQVDGPVERPPIAAPRPADVVPLRVARWWRPVAWAGGVAAAGLLLVGVAAGLRSSGSDDDVASDQRATTEAPGATMDSTAEAESAFATADSSAPPAEVADDAGAAATEAPLAADQAPLATSAPTSDARASTPFPMPVPGEPVVLASTDDLAWFIEWATPVPVDDPTLAGTPCLDAGPDTVVAPLAEFADVEAVVLQDTATATTWVYAADDCRVLARLPA